jgi:chromosome partitioning protein
VKRVVFNQKGGVGKSTITCNLAAVSAMQGRRTLVIDLDPQGNSTQYLLGESAENIEVTAADFFEQSLTFSFYPKSIDEFFVATPFEGLDLLASSPALTDIHDKLHARYKMLKLREALADLEGYDTIFIDTPAALNFYSLSALAAADSCLVPFDCDKFSRSALYALMENIQEIRQDHNAELELEGIVVNQYQARARLPQELVEQLKEEGLPILEPYISHSVKIRESHQKAKPMVYMQPKHKLSQQFVDLYTTLDGDVVENEEETTQAA